MFIQSLDKKKMSVGYDILCQGVHPWQDVASTPFFTSWCVVEPGKAARAHKHHEHETFFIVSGRGRMRVDDESREVGPGDAVLMRPFSTHELRNLDEKEDLVFIGVGWEDAKELEEANAEATEAAPAGGDAVLVLAAPAVDGPTEGPSLVNLAAEAHCRFLQLRGTSATLMRPTADEQGQRAQELVQQLHEAGHLVEREGSAADGSKVKRLVLPLEPFREDLSTVLDGVAMGTYLRAHWAQLQAEGLPEVAISSPDTAGPSVPVAGFEDQTLDSRFLRAAQELAAMEAEAGQRVQFFAVADSFRHAVLIPALGLATGGGKAETPAPTALVAVGGAQLSDGEVLGQMGDEALQFVLAHELSQGPASELQGARLAELAQQELGQSWQSWLASLGERLQHLFAGSIPGPGAWTESQQRFFQTLIRLNAEAARAYDAASFSLPQAARILCSLVDSARRYGVEEQPWQQVAGRSEEWRTAVALEVLAAKMLALWSYPLMPDFAGKLLESLGQAAGELEGAWEEQPQFIYGTVGAGLQEAFFPGAS